MERSARALVWVACFAAALAPLFAVRDLPLIDLPNHLAQAQMWLHWDDPAWGFRDCYTMELRPLPYVVYHGFLRYVGALLSVPIANKLWMSLSLVGLGGAMAYLLRGLGRPTVLALAALPLYYSLSTVWGFVNFMGSQSLLFLALGLVVARRFWAGTFTGAALYFVHPIGLAAWIGMAPLVARGWWRRLVVSLPAAVLFVVGMMLGPREDLTPRVGLRFVGHWWSLPDAWLEFPRLAYGFLDRPTGLLLAGIVVALVVVTALLVDRAPGPIDWRPALLFGMALAYYLALPRNIEQPMDLAGISSRFAPLVLLTALLLPPRGTLSSGRTLALLVPLLGLNVWHGAFVADKLAHGRSDERAFHRVVDQLPPRAEVLLVLDDRRHPAYPELNHVRLHQQALIQLERGGYDPQGWDRPFSILPSDACKARYPALELSLAQNFRWEIHGVYRWFVVRGDGARVFHDAPVEKVAQDRAWSIWRRND